MVISPLWQLRLQAADRDGDNAESAHRPRKWHLQLSVAGGHKLNAEIIQGQHEKADECPHAPAGLIAVSPAQPSQVRHPWAYRCQGGARVPDPVCTAPTELQLLRVAAALARQPGQRLQPPDSSLDRSNKMVHRYSTAPGLAQCRLQGAGEAKALQKPVLPISALGDEFTEPIRVLS